GILPADLDLDRLHWLRSRVVDNELLAPPSDAEGVPSSATRCGQSRDRRPNLYGPLIDSQLEAYDFYYFHRTLAHESEVTEQEPSELK
ncbi:MAG: hypothetical protein GXP23_06665, partial [Gammaproteobacteria bacterium]|nr:hypothetical protein [Gammaproteobacteria bacterium]